jgi:hypothetical protein
MADLSMTNWKNLVETNNAKTFVLPAGWDSRDDVAVQLECSPERVKFLLAPAIKGSSVEVKTFPVWDPTTKKVIRQIAYRRIPASEQVVKTKKK